jgi:Protein of unknown function (DUF3105)
VFPRQGSLLPSPVAVAGKRRTPPPPRRVQAPKTRKDPRQPVDRRKLLLVAGAAVVAAAIAAGAFFLIRSTTDSVDVATAMREAGCTYREVDATAAGIHIPNPDAMPEQWTTFPPTSGPHFGTPAIFGEYDEPVQLARAVHNNEHGGVVVYYGDDVAETQVDELRGFYRDDPTGMLLTPLPRLGNRIAMTAWTAPVQGEEGEPKGHLALCPRYDERAFKAFRDELRFKGPERFPPEALEPGM